MSPIQFFVSGDPKGQPRPRAFSRGGKARVYDPGTAEGWKSRIAEVAKNHCDQHISGPIWLKVVFFFKRPKGHYRTGKNVALLRDDAPIAHTSKPDADNAAKAVMDALSVIGVWQDDAQVGRLEVIKLYSDKAGAFIKIEEFAFIADKEAGL